MEKLFFDCSIGAISAYCDYMIVYNMMALQVSYFDSSVNQAKAVAAAMTEGKHGCYFQGKRNKYYMFANWRDKTGMKVATESVPFGRDFFMRGLGVSSLLGKSYLVSSFMDKEEEYYHFLMNKFDLPLMREWSTYLWNTSVKNGILSVESNPVVGTDDLSRKIILHGKEIPLADIVSMDISLVTQENLEEMVSNGIKRGAISVCKTPSKKLSFDGFDEYVKNYGQTLVTNLDKEVIPLTGLEPVVDTVALKHKRLYPQQACCVNGIVALQESGARSGLLVEGMGCGKSVQAATVPEAVMNKRWLMAHPGKSLKDCYESGEVTYRNVVICPGHLVEKWKKEVEDEIPGAKAIILRDLSQLVAIREEGMERKGKEFYILSKDFAKLSSTIQPSPSMVKTRAIKQKICKDCLDQRGKRVLIHNETSCPQCSGTSFMLTKTGFSARGLVCPSCGELLHKFSSKIFSMGEDEVESIVLTPADFAGKTNANDHCECCGEQLWTVKCGNLNYVGPDAFLNHLASRESKWHKVSHWANARKKNRKTAWVLKGHEIEYAAANGLKVEADANGVLTCPALEHVAEQKTRKVAPAQYIKKYLKGYFDYCIADELHKFSAAGSAQATACHALIKAANFTLGLTGTISNGTASGMFALLFRLNPRKLIEKGFGWKDQMAFARQYGCVEAIYEHKATRYYRSSSRGSCIQEPKVKPGVSPMLYIDFLLDSSVMLDLSDLSRYIPKLHENVVLVEGEEDIMASYNTAIADIKASSQEGEGMGALAEMLNFGLSYTDKPYGRSPVMSAMVEGAVITTPDNYEQYENPDFLTNKERKLVELVAQEMAEGRNCFVYASFTGKPEANITWRLKEILERHCNLAGYVHVLESGKGKAEDREKWIHEHAAMGMKVCICNPKVVETGLDFCFDFEGRHYNYPTLIFYQTGYELATMWQASRRAYRLNQTVECRTFYFGTEATLQQAAIDIMATKQMATSAIQGKFSTEGLAAMAQGVDPRVKLAEALATGEISDRKSIENMFDVMNAGNNDDGEDAFAGIRAVLYHELMGVDEERPETVVACSPLDLFEIESVFETEMPSAEDVTVSIVDVFDAFGIFDAFTVTSISTVPKKEKRASRKKKATVIPSGNTTNLAFMEMAWG